MTRQGTQWRETQISGNAAKLLIYGAFVEETLEALKHLAREAHRHYFEPGFPDFVPRTRWSLSNAFTSAFKLLEPVPSFEAPAKLGEFLNV